MVAKLDNGKYELKFEQNYGGIVDALVDAKVRSGDLEIEAYTSNFAGIIAAIQDLNVTGDAITGNYPPGWVPDGTDEGDYPLAEPADGTLWFDTRQGRLYVYTGTNDDTKGWYQTNGADGYVYVSPSPPSNPVTGQTWMDTDNNNQLYVMVNSTAVDPVTTRSVKTQTWVPVGGSTTITSTGNLPLETPTRIVGTAASPIEWPDTGGLATQANYNGWLLSALTAVDAGLDKVREDAGNAQLNIGENPPDEKAEGSLWFDTLRLDLNVYFDGYWISVGAPSEVTFSAASELDAKIESNLQLIYETSGQVRDLYEQNTNRLNETNSLRDSLNGKLSLLENSIYGFITIDDVTAITNKLDQRLVAEEQRQTDLSAYFTAAEVNSKIHDVMYSMSDHATNTSVDQKVESLKTALEAQIPDVTDKANISYVDQQINALDFLPATGGTIDGFKFNRGNISIAGLDFSNSTSDGINALAFKANGAATTNSFGTGPNPFEMAWEFQSNEDYCWIYNGTKTASISKDGIACTQLTLGSFNTNVDGVSVYNTIDVRDQLEKYQTAFTTLRGSVSNANDFESLKSAIVTALAGV